MGQQKNPTQQLAREIAREALFLPERERLWLFEQLREDFDAVDMKQHRIDRLNKRMSEAVGALERVAQHLKLNDQKAQLALTMREFDAAAEKVRRSWKGRQVADAVRGSWALAKAVAFSDERLPVEPEHHWKRNQGLARKRKEAAFALAGVQDWLAAKPSKKNRVAYERWSKARNKKLKPGQKPVLSAEGVQRRWPFPWPEVVDAVEEQRLPSERRSAVEVQQEAEGSSREGEGNAASNFNLDPQLRIRRLCAARKAKGWNLQQLSERAGIDPSHLHKIEKGEIRQPSFDLIAKLANALGLSLDALTTDANNR